MKKITEIFMILILFVTMMPSMAFAGLNTQNSATFSEGAILRGGDGKTYQFPKSEQGYIKIYYFNTSTGNMDVFSGQYESGAPKRSYVVKQQGQSYRGYCIEHGVKVDEAKKLSVLDKDTIAKMIYGGLSEAEVQNLQLALFYGYRSGVGIETLLNMGFADSKYYGEHGPYLWADWYMATQCLVWEIQQKHRTENMVRKKNDLGVSGEHYLSMLKGRPAVDIYNWMVTAIKNHRRFPAAIDGKKDTEPAEMILKNKTEDGDYTYSFKDTTGLGREYYITDIKGKIKSNPKIYYHKETETYQLTYKGELTDEVFVVRYKTEGKAPEDDLLFWGWKSNASHVQTIATGSADPVKRYIKFTVKKKTEEGKKPRPDYFPTFSFPLEKVDYNPGWDGDIHTGMGDASLGATYVLLRDGVEVDRITLDDYGNLHELHDRPWADESCLTETNSGANTHIIGGDPPANHCVVSPTKCEWEASVTYEIKEVRPDGRFIDPDTGIRRYSAKYYAVTTNSQTCTAEPEMWSDIRYKIEFETADLEGSYKVEEGLSQELEDTLSYQKETFVNDCYRGRIFLSKSKENEDVFQEEGSSGAQNKSTKSQWRIYLKSGGWETHPYIRFIRENDLLDGTAVYRVVRDETGQNNEAAPLDIGKNGCLYVYDLPYGTYIVEEVKADDPSFVLESFEQFVGEHHNEYDPQEPEKDNQYDWNIRNKKKENVIKVVKTDAETGKQVFLEGTKFYIRYMGNPLLPDPTESENYGRLLPNAANINSSGKDYTFVCDENGEITIPYDLEFGTYRLEEWLLPEGYFVGQYRQDGMAVSYDYGIAEEGQRTALENSLWDDIVSVYDKDGNPISYQSKDSYKINEVFNYYTFQVEKQEDHQDGQDYIKYYKAVAMTNHQAKGKIKILKKGEVLTDFIHVIKNGFEILQPVYTWDFLKDAVFGIFAAADILLNDGNEGPDIYDSKTDEKITIPTERYTHSGDNTGGAIYEEGSYTHASGAKLYFHKDRDISEMNHNTKIYKTQEQRPTAYSYTAHQLKEGIQYHYDVNVLMEYQASGKNITNIRLIKTAAAAQGFLPEIQRTVPRVSVGEWEGKSPENYESAKGNILDVHRQEERYEADGKKLYDTEGNLLKDLGDIGTSRYQVKEYLYYLLTEDDLVVEDGKTKYEQQYQVELLNPTEGEKAVIKQDDGYAVHTLGFMRGDQEVIEEEAFITSNENGQIYPDYTIPEGFMELPYQPLPGEDGMIPAHYVVIGGIVDGTAVYKVLLKDGLTWQESTIEGNFEKRLVEEYTLTFTQMDESEETFDFEWDGINISVACNSQSAVTNITCPFAVKPEVVVGNGYHAESNGNQTIFTASEISSPVYFLSKDGTKTQMHYFGGLTKTTLTVPMKNVDHNFAETMPSIRFGEGEDAQVIDWYSRLTPDQPIYEEKITANNILRAERVEGGAKEDIYYLITLLSDQSINSVSDDSTAPQRPFHITYADGYTAKVYIDQSTDGYKMGVMEIDGIYKTTRYALSDLVEVITSNDDGVAVSSSLPLGKYMVRELAAPDHYTADTEESWEVELKYKDQFTPLVWQQVNSKNNYFQVELDLQKHFETGYNTEQYIPGGGAVFGLFNAEPILYGKKSLPEDTLIDTVTVDGSGHALYRLKIPAGIYYLKELSTRTGYIIEDTPFYFAVGDIKSAPFEISKEKEGEDKDGITAKVVQDGFGAARLTIEVLKRYPTAEITVNGTTYVLDKNYAAENVAICTDPDMSRITVTASEEKPVQIILPNKKPLNITVKGNSYQWAYDGKEGTSVLPVAYTGYCADYTFKEQEDHNITLYDHQKTSGIIMKTFYEGEDEKRRKITELTAIEGQYISLWRNGEQLDLSEMVLPIRLKPEESLKIKMANHGIYTIYFNKDKTLEISISNVVKDILTEENGPSLTIDGQKAALNIHKNVTATRQDSGARSVQIKINSMNDTSSMPIQNKVGNTPEEPDIPWTPLPNRHYLQIIKSDKETGSPLMGAEFEIWSSKRTEKNGEYVPDKVLYTATTDAEGMIYFEVDAEEVLFCHEIKAPDGYIIDDRFHQINMKKDLTITNLHLHNEKATGALQLLKTDANSGKPLAFAGFHIFDTEGNLVFEGYTDEKGSIYCDALPIGTYWYQEFHAPKGYVIDHEKYSFTVNRNGQIVKVKAENQRKEIPQKPQEKDGTPPVPKTGDNRQIVFYFILLLLSVTILSLFLAYCRKKEEKRLRE